MKEIIYCTENSKDNKPLLHYDKLQISDINVWTPQLIDRLVDIHQGNIDFKFIETIIVTLETTRLWGPLQIKILRFQNQIWPYTRTASLIQVQLSGTAFLKK